MTKTVTAIVGALIGVLIVWALPGPLTLIMALGGFAAGLVVGLIVASYLVAQSRGEKTADVIQEVVKQATVPDTDAKERSVHEQLIRTDQSLRLGLVAPVILQAFEHLIDLLLVTVPKALAMAPRSETTFDLVRLGTDHLPEYASSFLALSDANRQQTQEALLQTLKKSTDVVEAAQRALDAGKLDEFEAQHAFMGAKFGA